MTKTELLAPAGNYNCMLAAFMAGADAVYLAGKEFGARAFAANFEEEELISALHYAHLRGKKIYLTLNTLIKEREFHKIFDYLKPYYENGLDGIIIQDLGLIPFLKENFPDLPLHASTQMSVNHPYGARFLQENNVVRVVPSRELSLPEIKAIKETGIEVETFIHGALCYGYSGQCLFSSFLGGRSGNRGKCAQPCRLPYQVKTDGIILKNKKEYYPISLKDLCTITGIYDLMDAGIDSFKIEGRMKSPEYVAGVTSIYRKYMDFYYNGNRTPVSKEDLDFLNQLYIRSNMEEGYYKRHNGKDMITLHNPSYQPVNEETASFVREKYCDKEYKVPISGKVILQNNQPFFIEVSGYLNDEKYTASVNGNIAEKAQNKPLTQEDLQKKMQKTGNTPFEFVNLEIETDNASFIPVGEINEKRRQVLSDLEEKMLLSFKRKTNSESEKINKTKLIQKEEISNPILSVSVMDPKQYEVALDMPVQNIYIPFDWLYTKKFDIAEIVKNAKEKSKNIYFSLPRILRNRSQNYYQTVKKMLSNGQITGVLVKNIETLYFLKEIDYKGKIIADHNIYTWNKASKEFILENCTLHTLPLECNKYELEELGTECAEMVVYGHMPMMVSANCVRKTMDKCQNNANHFYQSIIDRQKKELPVFCNCIHCYNIIYNALPLSLHKEMADLLNKKIYSFRMDFTKETASEVKGILQYYLDIMQNNPVPGAIEYLKEYTTGHYKKGAL